MQGGPLAARIREQVAVDVAALGQVGLATVLAGDDPASHIYVTRKHEAARGGASAAATVGRARSRDRPGRARAGEVVVVAIGRPGFVTADMVKAGAAVVDVGINRTEGGLVGDVDPSVAGRAGQLTPVPGGVGPMTIAMLLRNTVQAARSRRSPLAHPG